MWLLVAPATAEPSGVSDQLIIMVGGVITAAIVALGGVLVAIVNSRSGKTTPPAPATSADEHVLYERTAVHNQRLDDNDDRFDVLDKTVAERGACIDQIVNYLDHKDPGWRH